MMFQEEILSLSIRYNLPCGKVCVDHGEEVDVHVGDVAGALRPSDLTRK